MERLQSYKWWSYLEEGQQEGLADAIALLGRELENKTPNIHDFSFIVFPAAKAYEGFLKKLFFDLGVIGRDEYEGDRFRIGKALNPSLEANFRQESVYDRLVEFCRGKELPERLWKTWKNSRNLLFHWWPGGSTGINIEEAEKRLMEIIDSIDFAFAECKVKGHN